MSLLAVFSHCYGTSCSITDPTPTTSTGLGDPPQEQPYCQPYQKEEIDKPLQGRNCSFTTHQRKIISHTCKTLCPLETIKGEPGLTSNTRHNPHNLGNQHTTTPSEFSHRVASSALSISQSRYLGLSPHSQPACTPLLSASRLVV